MAQVELKYENIRLYGFPYACLLCGSDEDPKPRSTKLRRSGRWAVGCSLFLGPLAWIIVAVWALMRSQTGQKIDVPVCDCCYTANKRLLQRDLGMIGLGIALIFASATSPSVAALGVPVMAGGGILIIAALFEYAWLSNQFTWDCLKSSSDRVVLELPNDDYPSIYQRHLDTALLYGNVESLGATPEDSESTSF